MTYKPWKHSGTTIDRIWTNKLGPVEFEVVHDGGIYYLTTRIHGRILDRLNGLDFDRLVEPVFNSHRA
jgi:hypothetical protein